MHHAVNRYDNHPDHKGITAIRILLYAGARVDIADKSGETPLDLARRHGKYLVEHMLLQAARSA
ncbi:hypothetical protein BDW74DRAFT_158970 [Aspergillus multicolor]|uniref:uncharacterized protein n=1 Tax=Aspergillus multicolor TaxID=41759 RepID=UPI003CCE4125